MIQGIFLARMGVTFQNLFNDLISLRTYLYKKYVFLCRNVLGLNLILKE